MYPISGGYSDAVDRIKELRSSGHHVEALLASVFTVERTLKRTLKALARFRGFPSEHADRIVGEYGFHAIKNAWRSFDKNHRNLPSIVGNRYWQNLPSAVTMRNNLVHGNRTYSSDECKQKTKEVLKALDEMVKVFDREYGYDGWDRMPVRRKSGLVWEDPRGDA